MLRRRSFLDGRLAYDFVDAASHNSELVDLSVLLGDARLLLDGPLLGVSRPGSLCILGLLGIFGTFLEFFLNFLLLLLFLKQFCLGLGLVISELLAQLFLLLPDLVEVERHVALLADDLGLPGSVGAAVLRGGSGLVLACLLALSCPSVKRFLGGLLQLSEVHLCTFGIFFKDAVVGFLPFGQDVLQPVIRLGLGSRDKVSYLQPLLPKLHHAFIILLKDLRLAQLQLLKIALLLSSERLLLPRLDVNGLGQNPALLIEVLELFR